MVSPGSSPRRRGVRQMLIRPAWAAARRQRTEMITRGTRPDNQAEKVECPPRPLLPPGVVPVLSAKRKPIPHRLSLTDSLLAVT